MSTNPTIVPFIHEPLSGAPRKFKSKIEEKQIEVYLRTLSFDESQHLHHCIFHALEVRKEIMNNVEEEDDEDFVGPFLHKLFPKTLATTESYLWDTLENMDSDDDDDEVDELSLENWEHKVKQWLLTKGSPEDASHLKQQLRSWRKPIKVTVHANVSYMRLVNLMFPLMPGNQAPLDEEEMKQVIFDAHPPSWKTLFLEHRTLEDAKVGTILSYMKRKEQSSIQKDLANRLKQRKEQTFKQKKVRAKPSLDGDEKRPSKKARPAEPENLSKEELLKRAKIILDKNRPTDTCTLKSNHGNHTVSECKILKFLKKKLEDTAIGQQFSIITIDDDKPKDSDSATSAETSASKSSLDRNGTFSLNPHLIQNIQNVYSLSHHIDLCPTLDSLIVDTNILDDLATSYMSFATSTYNSGEVPETQSDATQREVDTNELLERNLRPESVAIVKYIQNTRFNRPLRCLYDPGSDNSYIHVRCLPKGVNGKTVSMRVGTIQGNDTMNTQVFEIEGLIFPEFSPTIKIDRAFRLTQFTNKDSRYDVIFGNDILIPLGIDCNGSTKTISWQGMQVPYKPNNYFSIPKLGNVSPTMDPSLLIPNQTETHYLSFDPNEDLNEHIETQLCASYATEIKESRYEIIPLKEVAENQKHLLPSQRRELHNVLKDFEPLFNGNLIRTGKLGTFKGFKASLELVDGAKPFQCRPYSVPLAHKDVFKKTLDEMVQWGILEKCGPMDFLSPTFIIPKKDGRVRWISDFRQLNRLIKRKVWLLPRIQDILKKRKGYKFFTKLDLSMFFYTFELDEASKNLCAIATPFGNYRYTRLPMGVKQSPDIAQAAIQQLFSEMDECDVYIDDVGIFSNNWDSHLQTLRRVLSLLQDNNFTCNPLKSEFCVQETDWLGYWLTPHGLKPWRKKIDSILKLQPPTTVAELRSFIGAVTFYRDMFPQRSHILAPLTAQVGHNKKKLDWTPECQQAFEKIKAILAKDAFLAYPDHNKPFHIYCDASDYQLGAAIFQDNKPVAYYSRKLSPAQRNYTVGEKEILSIVETLKEYRTMLYGCKELHVYTDHRNLTITNMQSQRVLRWRLFLEDFHPIFHYIKGEHNTLADGLSRLPMTPSSRWQNDHPKDPIDLYRPKNGTNYPEYCPFPVSPDNIDTIASYYSVANDPQLLNCFVHLPVQDSLPFVIDYTTIADAQSRDAGLQQLRQQHPQQYVQHALAPDTQVYCYVKNPDANWKIYLPNELLLPTIQWYHAALSHPGSTRLKDTMRIHFHNPKMSNAIEDYTSKCDTCQRYKAVGRGHGHTAPKEAPLLPWNDVAVDLIGPWTLMVAGQEIEFRALTIIDLVTNLVEIVRISDKTSANVTLQFENNWLARYPRPRYVIHDQGKEFTAHEFQSHLSQHGISPRCISTKNPQANAVCERMHQTIGNSLRVLATMNHPFNIAHAEQLVDTAIANAVYAHRCTYHGTINTTPGALAFHRDMILDLPLQADLQLIQQRRQQLIDTELVKANRKRFAYDYQPNDEVLKLRYKPGKLESRTDGPYRVLRVHTNGTLTIRISPYITERISIRRVKPYRR